MNGPSPAIPAPVPATGLAALSAAALGIVFGDIGTSPLYALRETFAGPHILAIDRAHVLGVLSLLFWSVTCIVSIKYVSVMMRADNRGEGGTLVLLSLVERAAAGRARLLRAVGAIGILGASLFYGDSMITPAISVLSAVEGLKVAQPRLEPWVLPLTIVVLICLFAIQRRGTGVIGGMFGPVMMLWFATLAVLGFHGIGQRPEVLLALSPHYAIAFLAHDGIKAFLTLGSVFLAVTGAEALYTDMGHFGKKPIRLAWYAVVLPSLMLNYFGQGALLLSDQAAIDNPFFRLAPGWAAMPLVVLATAATVIASQAVISGAFSLTQQAVQLGYLPRLRIIHTSESERGQIYIPLINASLLVFVIALVIGFGSSSDLAAAYGVAVSGTFILDTILLAIVMLLVWNWRKRYVFALAGLFFLVDISFFLANAAKIPEGGWFPLVVAACVCTLLATGKEGRALLASRLSRDTMPLDSFLASMSDRIARVPGAAVFLTANRDGVPKAMLHNVMHNKVVHERNILVTVVIEDVPRVPPEARVEAHDLGNGFRRILLHYGFMDRTDVPKALANAKLADLGMVYEPTQISYFLGRETLVPGSRPKLSYGREPLFLWMMRNAIDAMDYFQLPGNRVVELGNDVTL
jgi:KUP system potassium uptake protein